MRKFTISDLKALYFLSRKGKLKKSEVKEKLQYSDYYLKLLIDDYLNKFQFSIFGEEYRTIRKLFVKVMYSRKS